MLLYEFASNLKGLFLFVLEFWDLELLMREHGTVSSEFSIEQMSPSSFLMEVSSEAEGLSGPGSGEGRGMRRSVTGCSG